MLIKCLLNVDRQDELKRELQFLYSVIHYEKKIKDCLLVSESEQAERLVSESEYAKIKKCRKAGPICGEKSG